jgi:IS1 family transposase
LLEGNSVRSIERVSGVHRDTILDALVAVGEKCQRFLEGIVRDVPVADVQADDIWGFVLCKEKTKLRKGYGEECGDAYCFTAVERHNKMVLAWHLGKRSSGDCRTFSEKLRQATQGQFQLTTDGFTPYQAHVPSVFGARADFAILVKVYAIPEGAERRYTPPEVIACDATAISGSPDLDKACTSHVERANPTMRMTIRRLTRLTNAHSKKWENHEAALALYFGYYNFCRAHMTLTEDKGYKCSPAMAAGLTDHVWSITELLERAALVPV